MTREEAGSPVERAIDDLLGLEDLRSADRANLERMKKQLRRGGSLDYQERVNLWAYIERYRRPPILIRE